MAPWRRQARYRTKLVCLSCRTCFRRFRAARCLTLWLKVRRGDFAALELWQREGRPAYRFDRKMKDDDHDSNRQISRSNGTDAIAAAQAARLRYVGDWHPGVRRRRSRKTFVYVGVNGKPLRDREQVRRIKALAIPPAWTDVAINPATTGRLQAIGKDTAGRWQYLYHENHRRTQDLRKFRRITKFAQAIPKMRKTVARHLRQPDLGRERVLACVLRILSTCFMRPGSQVYASEHGSYGIATLRRKHVTVKGDVVKFDFPGKSGVRQYRELKDRQVSHVIRSLLKVPGYNVFKYQNGDGDFVKVTGRHINAYIKEVMGSNFSAKDFRTWAGTLVCACALAREETTETPLKKTAKNKAVSQPIL